ncbi:MAG: tripartite tricarboxylate transporter permease [Burkholderiales bacterium]
MDLLQHLLSGFQVSLLPINLLYCFLGVLLGTLIGVLPGIGPTAAIALLLPITFHVPAVSTIILLAGIYYGAMYGGSTTSILVNIPGEAASVVTCIDGYQMARQGRAGPALGISAFGSFIGGTLALVGLMFAAPAMARFAREFGAPEYTGLVCLGLSLLIYLGGGSIIKSLISALIGLALSFVGQDMFTGQDRFTLGMRELKDGIGLVPMFMGLFGISEVLINLEKTIAREVFATKISQLLPSREDWRRAFPAMLRGTGIGFLLGVIPGGSAVIASFASYALEKKLSSQPERFGLGAIEGVAGPETANNAAATGAFIPLFALGIPSNATTAILLGALMLHGVRPGPMLMEQQAGLFWGIIASMYVGNVILLVLNLPLIGLWVKILKVPYKTLFPLILLFCVIGAYSVEGSVFDVGVMLVFGVLGYALRKMGFEGAPLVLAFILGPMLENSLRQSLIISHGSFLIFVQRPIAAACLLVALSLLLTALIPFVRRKRKLLAEEA